MLKSNIAWILLINSIACFSQVTDDFPVIAKNDIPGVIISGSREFNGTSLFGYIDGGAELYLEYGFEKAVVTEFNYKGGKYKAEVYRMSGAGEAFGIYSVSRYRCTGNPVLADFACQNKYQLQFCKGPYYISIINWQGSRDDSSAMLSVGRLIAGKIDGPGFNYSEYLPYTSAADINENCFFARGHLGIVNGAPDLEDFFGKLTGYTAVVLKLTGETIISVKFAAKEFYLQFLEMHDWKPDEISALEKQIKNGLKIKLLSADHLYIKIED